MGHGASMKETTLHYYRDPLLDVVSRDQEVNLRGVIIVGTSDVFETKYLAAERVARALECARADGAIFSCNAIGNNHVDFAHAIEQTELSGIPVTALALCPAADFVVQNNHLDGVVCCYKTKNEEVGEETKILGENTITELDVRKALAMLKLKMRKFGK